MEETAFIYNPPTEPNLTVLFQDEHLLVLAKPSGLLSVPGRPVEHRDCLETRAKTAYPQALLVHRLDLATSGVFIMAMNPKAQKHLGHQFERRHAEKTYFARVAGQVEGESGIIDLPLIVDWPNRPQHKVDWEQGRSAQTHWEVVAREDTATRMRLTPHTGRTHQLRVHMRELGHPIIGDDLYAPPDIRAQASRLQLHAFSLTVYHPAKGGRITFFDPCPF